VGWRGQGPGNKVEYLKVELVGMRGGKGGLCDNGPQSAGKGAKSDNIKSQPYDRPARGQGDIGGGKSGEERKRIREGTTNNPGRRLGSVHENGGKVHKGRRRKRKKGSDNLVCGSAGERGKLIKYGEGD